MAVNVSRDTSFSSGAISFSALRSKFKKVSSGAVSLSELKRQTSLSLANPTVPNATENGNIPTTNSNIQLSDYRGSITYYHVTQTDAYTNFDIHDAQYWNNNLGKNVPKEFIINGTLGATSTSNYAARFNAAAFNLSIRINGSIQGAGGAGGTSSSKNGENGGDALYVKSNTTSGSSATRKIKLYNTNKIYAGGGGGGYGAEGGKGGKGGSVVGLSGGNGGEGGNGGNGGRGRGYNQTRTNGSDGSDGSDGANGATTTYRDFNNTPRTYRAGKGGKGGTGGNGGNGGDWGKPGQSGKDGSSGDNGESTDRAMTYYANWSGTREVTFGIYREAGIKNRIYFGNSFPNRPSGGSFSAFSFFSKEDGNGSTTEERSVPGGFYTPIWGQDADNASRGIQGIQITKRTGSPYQVDGPTVSLDDTPGSGDRDYNDLEVTPDKGVLYTSYSVSGSDGEPQANNHGSGGNPGKKISGSSSNYTIIS